MARRCMAAALSDTDLGPEVAKAALTIVVLRDVASGIEQPRMIDY